MSITHQFHIQIKFQVKSTTTFLIQFEFEFEYSIKYPPSTRFSQKTWRIVSDTRISQQLDNKKIIDHDISLMTINSIKTFAKNTQKQYEINIKILWFKFYNDFKIEILQSGKAFLMALNVAKKENMYILHVNLGIIWI